VLNWWVAARAWRPMRGVAPAAAGAGPAPPCHTPCVRGWGRGRGGSAPRQAHMHAAVLRPGAGGQLSPLGEMGGGAELPGCACRRYDQCGGTGCPASISGAGIACKDSRFAGHCCAWGYECTRMSDAYWQCLPAPYTPVIVAASSVEACPAAAKEVKAYTQCVAPPPIARRARRAPAARWAAPVARARPGRQREAPLKAGVSRAPPPQVWRHGLPEPQRGVGGRRQLRRRGLERHVLHGRLLVRQGRQLLLAVQAQRHACARAHLQDHRPRAQVVRRRPGVSMATLRCQLPGWLACMCTCAALACEAAPRRHCNRRWGQCGGASCAPWAISHLGNCTDSAYPGFCCPSGTTCARKDNWCGSPAAPPCRPPP
jgi:hypothetical protein